MENLSNEKINNWIRMKNEDMIVNVCSNVNNDEVSDALIKLFNSRTFTLLQDKTTYFYERGFAELLHMLELEYAGNWKEWELYYHN